MKYERNKGRKGERKREKKGGRERVGQRIEKSFSSVHREVALSPAALAFE